MMQDLLNSLPDGKPITSVCIVEDQANCPEGHSVVDRTFDQDIDADLWKDSFWGKSVTRYICLSKSTEVSNQIVEDMIIIGEKDPLPEKFSQLMITKDTGQKAMKKKVICLKLTPREDAEQALTDIIVLSKFRRPPLDFQLSGEINNLLICFKLTQLMAEKKKQLNPTFISPYKFPVQEPINKIPHFNQFSNISLQPPPFSALDDVPFEINSKYKSLLFQSMTILPSVRSKSVEEIEAEFSYDFNVEYQALDALATATST